MRNKIFTLLAAFCMTVGVFAQVGEVEYTGKTYTRHQVLVEQFTGQGCQYCPEARRSIDAGVERHPDEIAVVAHYHYSSGTLQIPGNTALAAAYNISGAPKCMRDRIAMSRSRRSTLIDPTSIGSDNDAAGARLRVASDLDITLEGSSYDPATRKLHIIVNGEVGKALPDLRINVMLTESGIIATQAGVSGEYTHNDVCRAYVTGALGEVLKLKANGTYRCEYEYTIPAYSASKGYAHNDPEQMRIVAFVNSYDNYVQKPTGDEKDFKDSEVHNCVSVKVADLPDPEHAKEPENPREGVGTVLRSETQQGIYGLDGRQMKTPVKGFNIIDGKKTIVK